MKRSILILTVSIFVSITLFGQNTGERLDSLVSIFVTQLENKGASKIGHAKQYCIGSVYTWHDENYRCDYDLIYYRLYLFWQNADSTFVKLFDNCGEFSQNRIAESDFLNFSFDNREKIISEEIKH